MSLVLNPTAPLSDIISRAVTPAISAGVAYAAGDALGGRMDFANVVKESKRTATIVKVAIVDDDQELAPVDIVFFRQPFTATADNAVFAPGDADMQNCLGFIDIAQTDYANFNTNSVAAKSSGLRMPFPFELAEGQTTLYAQIVVRGTPTYTATDDLTVILTIERD